MRILISILLFFLTCFIYGQNRAKLATGVYYPITEYELGVAENRADIPDMTELSLRGPELIEKHRSYVNEEGVSYFDVEALRVLLKAMVSYFNDLGYGGVMVGPHKEDMNARTGEDYRPEGQYKLRLGVLFSEVGGVEVQLKRMGEEIQLEKDTILKKVAEHSPLVEGNLFIPNRINSYLTRLSSHPGRVVNAVVDKSKKLGKLDINYTIEEQQRSHHSVYLQYANSGTKTTGEWVSRLGYSNNQFSQNDDVFRLDLVTADFGKTKTSQTSYERPLIYPDYLKAKVGGSWSEYKGQSNRVTTIDFDGSSWNLNAELSARPWMPWGYLLDWKTGLNLSEVESNSSTLSQFGSAQVLSPYFTLFMQKPGSIDTLNAAVGIRSNVYSITSEQMNALGRSNAEDKPLIMNFGFNRSMLLEQLVFRDAWSKEEYRKRFHLAHEFGFSLQGQYALAEDRLIPQEQFSVGGIYSVRGYPSSVASGDNGYFTSLEYRFYPNRIFMKEDERTQNGTMSKVFGQKNVNTTFRMFTDFGQVFYNQPTFGEEDRTLWSGGVGIDGSFYKLLNCRVDVATPFQSLDSGGLKVDNTDFGDLHIHFSGTLYY